jgi:serine/threonine protein kinase
MASTGIGLIEAVQAGRAVLGGSPRAHPSIENLEAYHRGSVDAESHERILDHLAECQDCTILLLYGVIEPHGHGGEPILPKARLEEAWDRLRPRLSLIRERDSTLASLLSEGPPLSLQRAIELAAAVARELARLHARGQVMSDLRPENIVIDSAGKVRVLDFGLAPSAETFEVGYGRASEDALVDLYRFLSPEQVVRDGLTPQSNLFSLGVLLYELLTGISPFRDSTLLATASRILSLDPVPVRDLAPEVDASLAEFIDQLLAKDPEKRPGDADRVARELDRMVERTASQTAAGAPAVADLEAQIEQLYDRIIHLSEDSAMDPSMRDQEVEGAFARLLELQAAEAERFRERFEASLEMPIDAGEQILARARRLREELEDITARDTAPGSSDTP